MIQGDVAVDYRSFADSVARTATHLQSLGVARGMVVGTALPDDIEHLVALFALAMRGAVILPIDIRWHGAEKANVAARFGAEHVLAPAGEAVEGPARSIVVDDAWRRAVTAARPSREIAEGGDLPLVIALSSGTSGRPKGPLISHENMLARFEGHRASLGFTAEDRFLLATPLYYGGGRGFAMSELVLGGTVILIPPPLGPAALVAAAAEHRATIAFLVPTQLRRLLDLPEAGGPLLGGLSTLISSGAGLDEAERLAVRRHLTANFLDYYSSTEGGGITVQTPAEQDAHPGAVGRPIHLVEVEIVDEADRRPPPGGIGRVRYRGPGVARGFHGTEAKDAMAVGDAFFRNGWFYPGDLGALDAAGYLRLRGRAKDVIIRGGVNIYPVDIEETLRAHGAVAQAAVVGRPSREWGEEIAAFVVLSVGAATDEAALIAHCRERLAPHKVPATVRLREDLPWNSAGKTDKRALLDLPGAAGD